MKKTPVIKAIEKNQTQFLKVYAMLKIATEALENIAGLTDGNQEYNASQFKWAQVYAQAALDEITK